MLIFWICSFCHKICPCIKSSLNSLFPAKDWQILSWTHCLLGLRSSYTSYPGGDGKGQFLIIQFFAWSPAALGQVKTICHISWQTAQEIFPMVGSPEWACIACCLLCIPSKDGRVGLESYSHGIHPSYNKPLFHNPFHFFYWSTGFSPSLTAKEVRK